MTLAALVLVTVSTLALISVGSFFAVVGALAACVLVVGVAFTAVES